VSQDDFDPDAKYRLARGPDHRLRGEEIGLLRQISDALDERVGAEAPTAERAEACREMVEEDESFAGLIERLQEVSESNPASLLDGLVTLARREMPGGDGLTAEEDAAEPAKSTLRATAKAIEEHETELADRLLELVFEEMPKGVPREEGLASIHRTLAENPEAKDLVDRLTVMAIFGGKVARRAMYGPFGDPGEEAS
jgi:hypothetical protein